VVDGEAPALLRVSQTAAATSDRVPLLDCFERSDVLQHLIDLLMLGVFGRIILDVDSTELFLLGIDHRIQGLGGRVPLKH
jgi:hypothetical protein